MAATPSAEENKALVRRAFEVLQAGDLDVLEEVLARDYTLHGSPGAEEDLTGRDAVKPYYRSWFEAFPDGTATIEELVAEEDVVAYRGSFTATHEEKFMGVPATDETVTVDATGFFRIEDGKIAEGWPQWDTLGLMQQLGVVEGPGE